MIGALLGGASLLGSLYAGQKGYDAMQGGYNPYDISALRAEQDPLNANLTALANQAQGLYQQGQDTYRQGEQFLDIGGEQNQLMRKTIQNQAMDAVALQNTLAQRNPNMSGGIAQQNLAANQIQAQKGANEQFLGAYQQNLGVGAGLMGQAGGLMQGALGAQQGVYNQQGQLVENMQQALIGNTEMANQQSRDEANYWMGLSGSLLGGIGGLF
jgi:hypothetical protein